MSKSVYVWMSGHCTVGECHVKYFDRLEDAEEYKEYNGGSISEQTILW